MSNQIMLTLAGDADSMQSAINDSVQSLDRVERAMGDVGAEARAMASQVGTSEQAFEGMARSSGALGESLDRASGGFSMLSGGIGDVGGALTAFTDLQGLAEQKALAMEAASLAAEQAQVSYNEAVAQYGKDSFEARSAANALAQAQAAAEPPSKIAEWGEKLELLSPLIMGAVGATDLMILSNTIAQASWVRSAASMVAARTAMVATSVATGVATAAQWLWNAAMTANPIGIIIVAIAALVAGIIWVATQTTWFQTAWEAVWGAVVGYIGWVVDNYTTAIGWIVDAGEWLIDQIKKIPGLIGSAFSTIYGIITTPFRLAFNAVSGLWNRTIGRLSWTVPGWVPLIGGNTISAPRLPTLHGGGRVPGSPGSTVPALLMAGETVGAESAARSGATVVIKSDGSRFGDLLVEVLARTVQARGGDVVGVLGGGTVV